MLLPLHSFVHLHLQHRYNCVRKAKGKWPCRNSNEHVACTQIILSVDRFETVPEGTKPRTSQHQLRSTTKGSTWQSTMTGWNIYKAIANQTNTQTISRATSKGKLLGDGTGMGFPTMHAHHLDATLNKQNWIGRKKKLNWNINHWIWKGTATLSQNQWH